MRVTVNQVSEGIATYIDRELVPKVPGIRKWILGMSGAYVSKISQSMIENNRKILVSSGIMSEDGMIDIDTLITQLKISATANGPVTEHIPILGDITFDSTDIDKLHTYIVS